MVRANLKPRTARARELRQSPIDAGKAVWAMLRARQVAGCKFRRQVPIDRFFADFACVERKLVVELGGSQHAEQASYDAARTEVLEAAGWTVLLFWNTDVLERREGVVRAIEEALERARP